MKALESLNVGVIVEQKKLQNRWQDFSWLPISVIPGAVPFKDGDDWKLLRSGKDWSHYLIGTLKVELFRGETEGYRYNLSNEPSRVYVVLSPGEEDKDPDVVPFLATVCPYEAESYSENGEDIVEGVIMPPEIEAWVQDFVDRHHVDQPFRKRKQKKAYDPRKGDFMRKKPPIGLEDEGTGNDF